MSFQPCARLRTLSHVLVGKVRWAVVSSVLQGVLAEHVHLRAMHSGLAPKLL